MMKYRIEYESAKDGLTHVMEIKALSPAEATKKLVEEYEQSPSKIISCRRVEAMNKYEIGNRTIYADSVYEALKVNKLLNICAKDSVKDDELEILSDEERKAIEDYKKAIANADSPEKINLYAHILREEIEHLEELQAVKNGEYEGETVHDERLSPMTYKKLKEAGVKPEQWKNWTQEQANEFLRKKGNKPDEKGEKPDEKGEKPDEKTNFTKQTKFDPNEKTSSLKKGQKVRLAETLFYAESCEDAGYDSVEEAEKDGFTVRKDGSLVLPKGKVMTYTGVAGPGGWPSFDGIELAGEPFKIDIEEDNDPKELSSEDKALKEKTLRAIGNLDRGFKVSSPKEFNKVREIAAAKGVGVEYNDRTGYVKLIFNR